MLAGKRNRPPGGFLDINSTETGLPVQYSTEIPWPINYDTIDHIGAAVTEFTIERRGRYRFLLSEANLKQPVPGGISIGRAVGIGSLVKLVLTPFTLPHRGDRRRSADIAEAASGRLAMAAERPPS
jgi:hypothetical protein